MQGATARVKRLVERNHNLPVNSASPFPIRTCVGCGGKSPQRALLRVASLAGAPATLDIDYRAPGRGAYLCRQARCIEQAWKRHALERMLKLKQSAPPSLKAELEQAVNEGARFKR